MQRDRARPFRRDPEFRLKSHAPCLVQVKLAILGRMRKGFASFPQAHVSDSKQPDPNRNIANSEGRERGAPNCIYKQETSANGRSD